MPVALGFALAISWSSALLAARFADPDRAQADRAEAWDARVRDEQTKRGWVPLNDDESPASRAARHLMQTQSVELRYAERPFVLALDHGELLARSPQGPDLVRAAEITAEELSRYPRQVLRRARLRRVLLCAGLAEAGKAITSLPNFQETLLLDATLPASFLRRLIHHEIFHFVDYADDDTLGVDPAWERLNDRYFVYGSGGRFMREGSASRLDDQRSGFLSAYATSALEEDKAEVFSFLLAAPRAVRRVAARDAIIGAKVRAVRQQVTRLLPELDAAFWREVERGQR